VAKGSKIKCNLFGKKKKKIKASGWLGEKKETRIVREENTWSRQTEGWKDGRKGVLKVDRGERRGRREQGLLTPGEGRTEVGAMIVKGFEGKKNDNT